MRARVEQAAATLAYAVAGDGSYEDAVAAVDIALEVFDRLGNLGRLGENLRMAASIEMELGRPKRAVVLAAATARHADEIGGNVTDSFVSIDVSGPAWATLGDEAYAAAEARGRAMSIPEAAEFAIASEDA